MRFQAARILRQFLISLCLCAGLLAIMNVGSTWRISALHEVPVSVHDVRQVVREQVRRRLKELQNRPHSGDKKKDVSRLDASVLEDLRESLAQDEVGEKSPFATLSILDPLAGLFESEIKGFRRQTLRSPRYKAEAGYDLLHYDLQYADGRQAILMAYVDYPPFGSESSESAAPTSVVLILRPTTEGYKLWQFRETVLVEERLIAPGEKEVLVSQRLNQGVPFLSVSR